MLIRDYIEDDYPQIVELWKETDIWGDEREDNSETIKKCLSAGGRLLIMQEEKNRQIIGTSWVTFDGRRMYLHHFCIKPSYQRKGHGKALTEATLRYIKAMGYQVKLEVHSENIPAIQLYEKYGFFRFEDFNIYMIRDVAHIPV